MGEEFLAITERSIYVRLGESDTAVRLKLSTTNSHQSDSSFSIGEEVFGQTGPDFKKATTSELAWPALSSEQSGRYELPRRVRGRVDRPHPLCP